MSQYDHITQHIEKFEYVQNMHELKREDDKNE